MHTVNSTEDAEQMDGTLLHLDIYGYRVTIHCAVPSVLSGLAEDFGFFRRDSLSSANVFELVDVEPPYSDFPDVRATVYTPRNVSYRHGNLTLVDYSGRALGVHDRSTGHFRLYSRDHDLLYEVCYLFLLSQCGETFDEQGLHRVHALGVSIRGHAALVLLPMGGGKSTLGSHLLSDPEVQFLSDDSPLIDHNGEVYAFPLRLGLLPGSENPVPKDKLRVIQRMEFGPKLLLNYAYFAERVVPRATAKFVFIGCRSLGTECKLIPASRSAALRAMLANCVVGIGLFQGMEFVFTRGPLEVFAKAKIGFSRLHASYRLLAKAKAYHLVLGRDSAKNARTLIEAVKSAAAEAAKK